ncbi:MAG: MFS transporter [Flavobacteriales bacterium]|jgi:predicted MFS family arabinose efflux permease|nr:MFS transporter [Flavobacteriales bacterium]
MIAYKQKPVYKYLIIAYVLAAIGFQGWRTLFNNFAVENVGITGFQIGTIQSVREIPGFLSFLVIYIIIFIKEQKLTALSLLALGIGVFLTGFFPSFSGLILTTFVMSLGFHYFQTATSSLVMQNFNTVNASIMFGKLRSVGALTNVAVGTVIIGLSYIIPIEYNFIIVGGLTILGSLYLYFNEPEVDETHEQHKKFFLRKKYWLYYVLNFLAGSRRQIFVVFAVFLLVDKFKFSITEVAILFVINNVIGFLINPVIARAINHFGERKVLSLEYIALFFIFFTYTQWDYKWGVALLYILDHVFFNFSFGLKTYLQKIADPKDIAPSNAVGFAINHIAAVVIPVIGGLLWMTNWQLPFYVGVGLCVLSLAFVQIIKTPKA